MSQAESHRGGVETTGAGPLLRWWRDSQLVRLLLLSLLVLLLLVPIGFISDLVQERAQTRDQALDEVAATWGGPQRVAGPMLVIPYVRQVERRLEDGTLERRKVVHHLTLLPEQLAVHGDIDSEVRYRGIYQVPLYRASLVLEGAFAPPDLSTWNVSDADVLWQRAQLLVHVSDPHAIDAGIALRFQDETLPFEPGSGEAPQRGAAMQSASGIHARLGRLAKEGGRFRFELALRGSRELRLLPFGRTTEASLAADWPHPSFQGAFLPSERNVSASGFEATWRIPHLARNYPQASTSEAADQALPFEQSDFGVDLIAPVDTYRMAGRSVKYAGFFLLLTFVVVWVLEVLSGRRVHSVQYLLTGAGCCLFYLLQTALAEHLGFVTAHTLASIAIVALVGAYSYVTLRSWPRACVVAGVLCSLYAYLYVMLTLEDYALLTGALALLIALASVMFVTRRVHW